MVTIAVAAALSVNWVYQAVRKPSELLFPMAATLDKKPADTWRTYEPIFRKYSTSAIRPEFLAALAQTEAAGNPAARTYWRWSWSLRPFDWYRPAASSVGLYQMTNGMYSEARHYCIRDHAVFHADRPGDPDRCGRNRFMVRVLPGDAVELTAAYLDVHVASALAQHHVRRASLQQRQHLAAVIHLCGAGAGDLYAGRGFRFQSGQRCGDHDPKTYVARIDELEAQFIRGPHSLRF